jgi:hypothetical protein
MEATRLSMEHRRQLLYYDWLPMRIGLAAVSLILALIIVMLPRLADPQTMKPSFPIVCWITALVPLGAFINFLVLGVCEYRLIHRSLANGREEGTNAA